MTSSSYIQSNPFPTLSQYLTLDTLRPGFKQALGDSNIAECHFTRTVVVELDVSRVLVPGTAKDC